MERLTEKQLHILRQKLCDMKNRCYNPLHKFYKDYGARGITVCDEWSGKDGHTNFQKWALENGWHEGCSIDRIDVNGNYEPSNCRWASAKEQANNRRNNKPITIKGVTKNASEWAEQIGISERAFMSRIEYGWDEDRLLEPKFKPLKMTKAEMAKEIREWRHAEEQGLLLRLPCPIGTTVYFIDEDWEDIYIEDSNYLFVQEGKFDLWRFEDFGKTWFLTKEEAEQTLAEMQKG